MKLTLYLPALVVLALLLCSRAEAQTYAITNALIVPVSGRNIDKGTVVIRDGLIEAVGATVRVPADAKVFNGSGLTVFPGFIDTLTTLGSPAPRPAGGSASGGSPQASPTPAVRGNSNYPAGLRPEDLAADDLRGDESLFEANRNAGFTTVVATGRTGIFTGRSAVIDLAGNSVSAMILKSPFAQHIAFTTIGGGQYPASLLGTFSAIRQMLLDARRLQAAEKAYAANPRGIKRPEADRSLEALFPVVDRQMPVVFHVNRENDIIRALDIAEEFNLRAIIGGGQEAWKVAERIKRMDVPVLLSLNFPKRTAASSPDADPEPLEILRFRADTPKGAAKLAQAGVRFAFQSDGIANINDLLVSAAKAVENGLPRDAAIRAMTLGAAEILGVGEQTGSIDPGKIANLVVVKGDVFAKDKRVTHVFVDGKLFEPKPPSSPPPAGGTSTAGAPMAVGGNYSITIEVPGQPISGSLAMTQQGAILSGTLQTAGGTTQIKDGKVANDGFTFGGTVEFGGSLVEIVVRGTVTGTRISGTIDTPQGVVPFTGTRNP